MSGIYLIQDGGGLLEMRESPYDSEDLLQRLLGQHPDLLAGDQIDPGQPRRWVLVSREMVVPGEADGSGRWSLDHLFLDQDAIPTLVEVKRGTDTRIRREVVGQMLDYAANAVVYWPVEEIRAKFEATCAARRADPEAELAGLIGDDADPAEFWQRVKTNLQAGRVRLLFVADEIPPELRRVVEFLNEQMDPAEVLAVEIRQFVGQGMKTLVPRVLGQTAAAQQKKAGGSSNYPTVDRAAFLDDLLAQGRRAEESAVRAILGWSDAEGLESGSWRTQRGCSFIPTLHHRGTKYYPISLRTSGHLILQMRSLVNKPPFASEEKQAELLRRLNAVPGVNIPEDRLRGMPSIPLALLASEDAMARLLDALGWLVGEIRAS